MDVSFNNIINDQLTLISEKLNPGNDVLEDNSKYTASNQLTLNNSNVTITKYKSNYVKKLIETQKVVRQLDYQYLNIVEVSIENKNKNDYIIKKKKRLRIRKSDPEVNNISNLLENCFQTPNKLIDSVQSDKENTCVHNQEIINNNKNKFNNDKASNLVNSKMNKSSKVPTPKKEPSATEQTSYTPTSSEKRNAFQFMMDSRHRTIGSNSPGRERVADEQTDSISREKLHERKRTFKEWAENKGGAKRKLDEHAKDKYIERTLNNRAKRMKKLLSMRQSSQEDEDELVKVSVKKPRILSDSENSNDANENITHFPLSEVILHQNTVNKCVEKSNSSSQSENSNDFTENLNDSNPETVIFQVALSQQNDESDEIFSPRKEKQDNDILLSPSLKKTSLLHYFDVTNKINSPVTDKKKTNCKPKLEEPSLIKVKLNFTPKKAKHEKNNVTDESLSLSNKSKKIKKKHRHTLSLIKSQDNEPSDSKPDEIKIEQDITNQKENLENTDVTDNKITVKSNKLSLPIKKHKRNKNKHSDRDHDNDKCNENEKLNCKLTPRRWKMKLKFGNEPQDEKPTENTNEVVSVDDNNDKIIVCDDNFEIIESDDEIFPVKTVTIEQSSMKNDQKKSTKLAPLFLLSRRADVLAANQAKRRFLHSGVPSGLKNNNGRSSPFPAETELTFFPNISHIQQSNNEELWKLPVVNLPLLNMPIFSTESYLGLLKLGTVTSCSVIPPNMPQVIERLPPGTLPHLKYLVQQLKQQQPNYPIYRVFKSLRNKCGVRYNKPVPTQKETKLKSSTKKKRGRPKKKKEEEIEIINLDDSFGTNTLVDMSIWSEKYKPKCASDVLGNVNVVHELETWLQNWAKRRIETKLRERRDSTSSDDFCITDSDTRDSYSNFLENTLILTGPHGSGKTCAVYAICHQLNINVIEINASSRRLGKKLLAELQEATKSHRVKSKNELPFVTKNSVIESSNNGRVTLLLVEDADIVFDDQDEGFINALNTLIASSKRPIVVTTSNPSCFHLQKLISQHRVLEFAYIPERQILPWLEILCLCEGLRVDREQLLRLLRWTNADLRQTLLYLQFWVLSGGDKVNSSQLVNSITENITLTSEVIVNYDDDSNLSWVCEEESQICSVNDKIHVSCVTTFIPYYEKDNCSSYLPFPLDLGNIWWNLQSLCNIKFIGPTIKHNVDNIVDSNLLSNKGLNSETEEITNMKKKGKTCELRALSEVLDCMAIADITYTRLGLDVDHEPYDGHNLYKTHGVSINETFCEHSDFEREQLELTHFLVEKNVQLCLTSNEQVDVGLPSENVRKERKQRITYLERFAEIAYINSQIDRKALSCDYASTLRDMCRSERLRCTDTGKRNNRFYHYLRALATPLTDVDTNIACKAFNLSP